ncbi:MAG: hypothetical protein RBR54_10940 [Sulfurimonas sp.]|jgi:hypothetical protein|nr:hypothetical protein [Sulfurimonas sp.]
MGALQIPKGTTQEEARRIVEKKIKELFGDKIERVEAILIDKRGNDLKRLG